MKYQPIQPELFVQNRLRFMRKMQPDSIAIFYSNDVMPRSGDTSFPFRQNSGLFYLSGLDQEETVLVLFPDCLKEGHQEVAFIRRTNEHLARWEGEKLSKDQARAISGIDKIFWLEELPNVLHELILLAKRIYLNVDEQDRFQAPFALHNLRQARELQAQYPGHKYHRAQPILRKLMMIKSPTELELMQQAIAITGKAFRRTLEFVKPGVMEYELEAEITHEFLRNRATGHAYAPILASGANNCVLHYTTNNQECRAGDLVLMDFGAEYANYAADLTRTIPVSGQFSPRQRAVYLAVMNILEEAKKLLVPGTTLEEYQREVISIVEGALLDLKLIHPADLERQDPAKPLYKQFFPHSISHHLGLDVHDLADRYAPIQAGMVFTCEPGIYLPDEEMGIRLENNILVTDEGPIDLMAHIALHPDEIEEIMQTAVFS